MAKLLKEDWTSTSNNIGTVLYMAPVRSVLFIILTSIRKQCNIKDTMKRQIFTVLEC
jgi:hypothetical protein